LKIALYEMTVTLSYGGIQTSYWETARRLAAMGHTVHLYGGEGSVRWEVPGGVTVFTFPFVERSRFPNLGSRFRKFAERVSFGRHALGSLLREQYDILYIRKPYEFPISLYVRGKTGARVVYRSGGTDFFPGYASLARRLDSFLSCSGHNASQIASYCGLRPGVLYNGVDTDRFRPVPKDPGTMMRLGLSPDDFVVMSVGRLVGWKGMQVGIEAMTHVQDPKVKYVIVGSGEYQPKLERLVRERSLGARVFFPGAIPAREMPAVYSAADVVLFPTIGDDDAFPNTLCEAMASGKPAIGTTKGGIPEGIVEGETGYLVPPRDPEAIAAALCRLRDRPDLRAAMGIAARSRAEGFFSWDTIVKRLEGIFRDLMEDGRGIG